MFLSSLFDGPVGVAAFVVTALAATLHPVFAGASTAVAVVCFTVAVRLLLLPLSYSQLRAERTRAALQPKIRELRDRHRDDPERLQQELAAMYRAQPGAMFAGCLPALAQLPFFLVMYRLFAFGDGDGLLRHQLLGVPLGDTWLGVLRGAGLLGAPGLVFLGLFVLLALVAWWTSRRLRTADLSAAGPAGSLLRVLPFGTVMVAAVVPLAAGLYLLTTTTWTAAERGVLGRWLSAGGGGCRRCRRR